MKLLKVIVVLTVVAGLLLGGVLPALADTGVTNSQPSLSLQLDDGQGRWAWGKVKVIRGVVAEDGVKADKIILESGEEIFVNEKTRYRVPTVGRSASLEDIKPGMRIVALVYEKEEGGEIVYYARYIVVIPSRPVYGHHVGKLLEYKEGESITIEDKWGNKVTFEIGDTFKILPAGTDMEEAEAQHCRVTVITRGHPISGSRIAVGVVVHLLRPWLGLGRVSGTISQITDTVITIDDETEVTYDDQTVSVLRGILAVEEGQTATILYRKQPDDTLLAKLVLIGIDPPSVLKAIEGLSPGGEPHMGPEERGLPPLLPSKGKQPWWRFWKQGVEG